MIKVKVQFGKRRDVFLKGAKQSVSVVGKKGKSYLAARRIRQYEESFDPR